MCIGKYKESCFRGHIAIGFHGLIIGHTGPHIGKRNDVRMWHEHEHKFLTYPGEFGLGDKAYGGCGRMLCPRKRPQHAHEPPFTAVDAAWNDLLSHYHSRVERIIKRVKSHAWCEHAHFYGSYALLVQFMEVTVSITALEIREEFLQDHKPMFEVVGPWDHVFL